MSEAASSDEDSDGGTHAKPIAVGLAALLQQDDESDSDDDDADDEGKTAGGNTTSCNGPTALQQHQSGMDSSANSSGAVNHSSSASNSSSSVAGTSTLLPSADELLDASNSEQPEFLKLPDGPDFDASKAFKPPPVSHADMVPAVRGAGSRRTPPAALDDVPPEQRYHQDHVFSRGGDAVRQHGSVCRETDEERGRRVVYGAHQVVMADPWSNCNPNFSFKGFGAGKKRKAGDT